MLIRRTTLDQIVAGTVTLQFRKWRRPTVKAGGTLLTAVGQLAIDEVERVADRLCVLERGRVIYEGALEDFRAARRRFAARVTGPVAWPDGVTEDTVEGQSIVVADGEESARMLLDGLIEGVDILEELPVRDLKEAFLLATSGTEEQR